MKKIHFTILYILILCLVTTLGFIIKLVNEKPKERIIYLTSSLPEEVLVTKPIQDSEKPAIPVEAYLIQQYCQKNIRDNFYVSSTNNWTKETWNDSFVNYVCKKTPDEGFATGVLCSELFNPKLFNGRVTQDQKNCTFEAK